MMKENGKEVPQAVKGWNWGAFSTVFFGALAIKPICRY